MTLDGQKVIVFGGASGIGLATARLAAQAGAQVTIVGRDAFKLNTALETLPQNAQARPVDATYRDRLDAFFADAGTFDHLALSISSGGGAGPFAKLDFQTLRQAIEGKLVAQLKVVQSALATLSPTGSITFVTAASARAAFPERRDLP